VVRPDRHALCALIHTDERAEHLLRQDVLGSLFTTTDHGGRPGENKARHLRKALRDREDDIRRFVVGLTVSPTPNEDPMSETGSSSDAPRNDDTPISSGSGSGRTRRRKEKDGETFCGPSRDS
jgi:hypothetical protein